MDFLSLMQRLEEKRPLDFGDIFSKSFELYKKIWVQGFLFILCQFLFIIPVFLIAYIPLLGTLAVEGSYDPYSTTEVSPFAMLGSLAWFYLSLFGGILIVSFLMYALQAGFYRMLRNTDETGAPNTSDLFYYLKGKYLSKTFMLGISAMFISLLAMMLCFLPAIYVGVPLGLITVVFAFNPELSVSENIKVCFKLGNTYWFTIFGLVFVSGFLAEFAGMIACGIGVFFTISFALIPQYYVYKDAIGFDEKSPELN